MLPDIFNSYLIVFNVCRLQLFGNPDQTLIHGCHCSLCLCKHSDVCEAAHFGVHCSHKSTSIYHTYAMNFSVACLVCLSICVQRNLMKLPKILHFCCMYCVTKYYDRQRPLQCDQPAQRPHAPSEHRLPFNYPPHMPLACLAQNTPRLLYSQLRGHRRSPSLWPASRPMERALHRPDKLKPINAPGTATSGAAPRGMPIVYSSYCAAAVDLQTNQEITHAAPNVHSQL